jgi:thiamine-phosphate pyrophosphorylase
MNLPTLYAILDAESCTRRNLSIELVAEAWHQAGITLLQYRDKQASDTDYLTNATKIKDIFQDTATLIINDRAHLVAEANWQGVHIGQTDLSPQQARELIGPHKLLGLSTHTPQQVQQANKHPVDYIAIGPVFSTTTKLDAEPTIGLEGVRTLRALTEKPLVAIGGITRANALQTQQAGADSVAVISALLSSDNDLIKSAQDFLAVFK